MFTSDKKQIAPLIAWAGVTAFCAVFSYIYEYFSHGVYSDYMLYLFMFPLLGGVLPALVLLLPFVKTPGRFVKNTWNSAVATLSLASCLEGVFEIYGSVSNLIIIYWIAGYALLALSIIAYAASCLKK